MGRKEGNFTGCQETMSWYNWRLREENPFKYTNGQYQGYEQRS